MVKINTGNSMIITIFNGPIHKDFIQMQGRKLSILPTSNNRKYDLMLLGGIS